MTIQEKFESHDCKGQECDTCQEYFWTIYQCEMLLKDRPVTKELALQVLCDGDLRNLTLEAI